MATAPSISTQGGFSIGRVLARAGEMMQRRFGAMLVVALLLVALPIPIKLVGAEAFARGVDGGGAGQFLTFFLAVLAGGVFGAVALGALIRLAVGGEDGRPIHAADALYLALRSAPRLIGLYLMTQVAVLIAMLLLVVPGVVLFVGLAVAMPAAVIEGRGGTRAFDRSFDLTKGARWRIFALWLILWVALTAANYLLDLAFGRPAMTMAAPPIAFVLAQGAAAALWTITIAAVEASVYVELRTWKEGAPQEELREIFA